MHPRTRQRDKLEIIIDTCSLGFEQLRAIETLLESIQSAHPRIYTDYRIVVPVQLGTEVRQRIYPEFLRAEMERPHRESGGTSILREFWHKHLDHIEIVDTAISQAYRLQYAKSALPLIADDAELEEKIVTVAQKTAQRFGASKDVIDRIDMDHFHMFGSELEEMSARQTNAAEEARIQLEEHYATSDLSDKQRDKAIASAELQNLARHQRGFEKLFPPEAKYFMQALYSQHELYTQISRTPEFKDFRFNKGERAIEDFIFHERDEHDPNLVSLIVSEDVEARDEIKALRDRSKNTVIVVGKSGLLQTASWMTDSKAYHVALNPRPASNQPAPLTPQKKWMVDPRNPRHERLATIQQKESEEPLALDPITEHQWAIRLTHLLKTGQLRPHRVRQASANSL